MKASEVRWALPEEVARVVRPMLREWLPLVPSWVARLEVRFDAEDVRGYARVGYHFPNRWANIYVAPAWIDLDEDQRRKVLLHEVVHLCQAPLLEAATACVEELLEKGPARKLAKRLVEEGQEQATQDTADAITRLWGTPGG